MPCQTSTAVCHASIFYSICLYDFLIKFLISSSSSSSAFQNRPSGLFHFRVNFWKYQSVKTSWNNSLERGQVQHKPLAVQAAQTQKSIQAHIHAPSRIQTHDPRVQTVEDTLRLQGQYDLQITISFYKHTVLFHNILALSRYFLWMTKCLIMKNDNIVSKVSPFSKMLHYSFTLSTLVASVRLG